MIISYTSQKDMTVFALSDRFSCARTPSGFRSIIKASCLLLVLLATGCASSGGVTGMMDKTLQVVGIREKVADGPPAEKSVELRLFPGKNLNSGNRGRPLALVVRIYHLRSAERFEQAPFDVFLDASREQSALGDDLLQVNEIVLVPGKPHQLKEAVSGDARALGIVALFMAPSQQRWRFVFDARHKSLRDGLTIGLHACAMTTTSPALLTVLSDNPESLASARCQTISR